MLDLLKKQNDEIALITKEEKLTYGSLRKKILYFSKKFKPKSVNILLCTNSIDSIIIYLSLLYAGAIPLLLNNELDTSNIKLYKEKFKAKTVISESNKKLNLSSIYWDLNNYIIYEFNEFNQIKNKELSLLLTTSGSTGNPKVVRISKKNIVSNTKSICKYLSINKKDRHITTLPMNYTYGLSCINTFLYSGASIVLNKYSLLERGFWDLMKKYKPTSFSGVPYTYEVLHKIGFEKIINSSSSIKCYTQAGGKLDKKILKDISELCIQNKILFYVMYGQTEATARMSYLPPERILDKIDSIGIAIPGGKFEIDNELKDKVSLGKESNYGELIYKGENVSLGYAEDFKELDNDCDSNNILRTGDLAYMDNEKYIYIVGRLNRFAKINGIRVSLYDIEEILKEQNYSIAVTSDDKNLNIYVEGDSNYINIKKIKETLINKTTLPPVSFKIFLVNKIPRNDNGKINYHNLRKNGL